MTRAGAAAVDAVLARWQAEALPATAVSTSETPLLSQLVPDLTGDGHTDVAVFTTDGEQRRLTCRRGSDGTLVRALDVPTPTFFDPIDPAWRALVLYHFGVQTDPASQRRDVTLTVTWTEGCAARWTQTFTGRIEWVGNAVATSLPYLRGQLPSPGQRPALLVERVNRLTPMTPFVSRHEVVILSGDDGSVLHTHIPPDFVDESPAAFALPDLTGDGLGDYAFAVEVGSTSERATGQGDRVDAYDSTAGTALWTSPVPFERSIAALDVGDVDRDGTTDFVASAPLGDIGTRLVSGATGEIRWHRPGRWPRLLGGDLVRLTKLAAVEGTYWLEVSAVGLDGRTRYTRRFELGSSVGAGAVSGDDVLGDVDADGYLDVVYRVTLSYSDHSTSSLYAVVSGRRGTVRRDDVRALLPNGFPTGTGSVDGSGDDVWSPARRTVELGERPGKVAGWVGAGTLDEMVTARLDGDACPDFRVVTNWRSDTPELYVASGATGEVLWSMPPGKAGTRVLTGRLPRCAAAPVAAARRPNRPRIPATGGGLGGPAALALAGALVAARAAAARRTAQHS